MGFFVCRGQLTPRAIADARASTEVLLCLSADSWIGVDDVVETAGKAGGGSIDPAPRQYCGFMYGRSFEDPDGQIGEVVLMEIEAARAAVASRPPQLRSRCLHLWPAETGSAEGASPAFALQPCRAPSFRSEFRFVPHHGSRSPGVLAAGFRKLSC